MMDRMVYLETLVHDHDGFVELFLCDEWNGRSVSLSCVCLILLSLLLSYDVGDDSR